jgi:hypothetical protein
LLALAGIALLVGFGFMAYEGTRLGAHADPWHHFWFEFGVGWLAFAALMVAISVFLFAREMRDGDESESTSEGSVVSGPTSTPSGEVEEEIVRRFRRPEPRGSRRRR